MMLIMPMTSSSLIFCVHNCVPIIVSVLYSCRFFMIAPCSVATSSFNSHWKHQTPKCLLIAGSTEALGGPRLHNKWFLDYECLTSFHKEDPIHVTITLRSSGLYAYKDSSWEYRLGISRVLILHICAGKEHLIVMNHDSNASVSNQASHHILLTRQS